MIPLKIDRKSFSIFCRKRIREKKIEIKLRTRHSGVSLSLLDIFSKKIQKMSLFLSFFLSLSFTQKARNFESIEVDEIVTE